jgi:hypothetical protein
MCKQNKSSEYIWLLYLIQHGLYSLPELRLPKAAVLDFIVTTFHTGRLLFYRGPRIMLAHFSAIRIVKVHSVTTFPTGEPLLSAYVPKLFYPLPIGHFADTS